jgi:hypothetical protein
MSSMDIAAIMDSIDARQGVTRPGASAAAAADAAPLRVVLCPGELLRLPRRDVTLTVLSGSAWITRDGRDMVLGEGERLELAGRGDRAVVSALGTAPLLLETRRAAGR